MRNVVRHPLRRVAARASAGVALAVVVVLALLLVGCGGRSGVDGSAGVASESAPQPPAVPVAESPVEAVATEEVGEVVADTGPSVEEALSSPSEGIVPVPTSDLGVDPFDPIPGDLVTVARALAKRLPGIERVDVEADRMLVRLASPSLEGGYVNRASWEGRLFQAVLVDQLHANERLAGATSTLGSVTGVDLVFVDPSGIEWQTTHGIGNAVPEQRFVVEPEHELRAAIAKGAERLGLDLVEVELLYPVDQAVAVVVRARGEVVPVISRFVRVNGDGWRELFAGSTSRFEGWYLELRDATGRPVYVANAANRGAAGNEWLGEGYTDMYRSHPAPVTGS